MHALLKKVMIFYIDDKKIEVDLKKYLFSENGLHQIHPIKKDRKSFWFVFHLGPYSKFMHNVKRLEGLLSTILPFEKKIGSFSNLVFCCFAQFSFWSGGTMGPLIFSIHYDFKKAFYLSFQFTSSLNFRKQKMYFENLMYAYLSFCHMHQFVLGKGCIQSILMWHWKPV